MFFQEKSQFFSSLAIFLGGVISVFRAYHIDYNANIDRVKPVGEKKKHSELIPSIPSRMLKKGPNLVKRGLEGEDPLNQFFFFCGK